MDNINKYEDISYMHVVTKVPYSKFIDELVFKFPSLSSDYITNSIKLVCMDMCYRTRILRRYRQQDIYCGINEYPILMYPYESLVQFYNISIDDELQFVEVEGTKKLKDARPNVVYLTDNDTYVIPKSKIKGCIKYSIAIAPNIDSKAIDSVVYNRHYQTIYNGTAAKLYLENTPQFNQNLSMIYEEKYIRACDMATTDKSREFNRKLVKIGGINYG